MNIYSTIVRKLDNVENVSIAELESTMVKLGHTMQFTSSSDDNVLHMICASKMVNRSGFVDLLEKLCGVLGYDITGKNNNGKSSLHVLAENQHISHHSMTKIYDKCVQLGADPLALDSDGSSFKDLYKIETGNYPWNIPMNSLFYDPYPLPDDTSNVAPEPNDFVETLHSEPCEQLKKACVRRDINALAVALSHYDWEDLAKIIDDTKYTSIILQSNLENIFSLDDQETLRKLVEHGFKIDLKILLKYCVAQQNYLDEILKFVDTDVEDLKVLEVGMLLLAERRLSDKARLAIVEKITSLSSEPEKIINSIILVVDSLEEEQASRVLEALYASELDLDWQHVNGKFADIDQHSEQLEIKKGRKFYINR